MKILISIFLLSITFSLSHGLKCYVCSKSASDKSDECVNNPGAVTTGAPVVTCPSKYCTIKRQEYKDPPGRIASFYRGCENNPVYLNTMIEDADFKTYFRACTADLCNTGNGIQLVNNNQNQGRVQNLMVPGIGSSGVSVVPKIWIFMILSAILTLYNRLD